jgi:hypothetical protein
MNKFNVVFSPETFEKWGGDICDIYITLDSYAFPDRGWTDFGFGIIFVWANNIIELLTKTQVKLNFEFMDGAVRFDIEIIENDNWKIKCIREYADDEDCLYQSDISGLQVAKSILETVTVMKELRKKRNEQKAFLNYQEKEQDLIKAIEGYKTRLHEANSHA